MLHQFHQGKFQDITPKTLYVALFIFVDVISDKES